MNGHMIPGEAQNWDQHQRRQTPATGQAGYGNLCNAWNDYRKVFDSVMDPEVLETDGQHVECGC